MLFRWLGEQLGLNEVRERLSSLESKVDQMESHVDTTLRHFGGYRSRTSEELKLMEGQIDTLLDIVEDVIDASNYQDGIDTSKKLRKRLRNHKTRIQNARSSQL